AEAGEREACAAAVDQWHRDGPPANPGGWVVAVARRRALDHLRRESARAGKERDAAQEWAAAGPDGSAVAGDDQLALLFACCHPALDPASRVTLTLRVVCGLPTASTARLLLLSEPASPSGSSGPSGRSATRASGCGCPIRARGRPGWRRC